VCHLSFPGKDLQTEHNYEVYPSSRDTITFYRSIIIDNSFQQRICL